MTLTLLIQIKIANVILAATSLWTKSRWSQMILRRQSLELVQMLAKEEVLQTKKLLAAIRARRA